MNSDIKKILEDEEFLEVLAKKLKEDVKDDTDGEILRSVMNAIDSTDLGSRTISTYKDILDRFDQTCKKRPGIKKNVQVAKALLDYIEKYGN